VTTFAPAWMGVLSDHLIESCSHRLKTRRELEPAGWWKPLAMLVDPDGPDLCGWCVRVWKARNR
jgi:hypothetical protein